MENQCLGCGCTDNHACTHTKQPCHWLKVDTVMGIGVCSNCAAYLEEFKHRQASLVKLAEDK